MSDTVKARLGIHDASVGDDEIVGRLGRRAGRNRHADHSDRERPRADHGGGR